MGRTRRGGIITLVLAALIGLGTPSISHAQFGGIVFDPNNYRQNLLTAIRNYAQVTQQANQLRNEAQMLINQAKNLSKLDINSANDLLRILNDIAALDMEAENVAYEVGRTRALIKQHFPQDYAGIADDEYTARAEAQWQMSRAAYNDAMVMQSKLVESLASDRNRLGQLMGSSHASIGELQAVQSTNQLLGLLIKQNMQAQHMQITQSRADSIEQARRLAIEKESRALRRRFVGSDNAYGGNRP